MINVIGYTSEPYPAFGAFEFAEYLRELGFKATGMAVSRPNTDLSQYVAELTIGINQPRETYNIKGRYATWCQDACSWLNNKVSDPVFGYDQGLGIESPMPIPSIFFEDSDIPKSYVITTIMNKGEPIEDMLLAFGLESILPLINTKPVVGWENFKNSHNPELATWLEAFSEKERFVVERCMLFHNINEGMLRHQTKHWLEKLGVTHRVLGHGWSNIIARPRHFKVYKESDLGLNVNGWDGPHHRDYEIMALGLPCIRRANKVEQGKIGHKMAYKELQDKWFSHLIECLLNDESPKAQAPDPLILGRPWTYNSMETLWDAITSALYSLYPILPSRLENAKSRICRLM